MAGHSHWAGIKHKKALVDSKRSKLWSKLSKAIIVAAKLGGGDPDNNIRLRTAIQEAKSLSLPKDNIERAIKKGTGEIDGGNVEETMYEGYGPAGVAILCDIMTDNRNRTAPEIRKIFDVHGGSLGGSGCVAYIFERKGMIAITRGGHNEEQIMEIALENEAQDIETNGERIEIYTAPEGLTQLATAFEQAEIALEVNEVVRVPQTTVDVDSETAKVVLKLLETLEDHDDVQSVCTNLNFDHQAVAELLAE
ncbi:MAG: YebC/PmpR family DNA-binding transcriptional regulator [Planctomycetales bacterium]|nr:YebC/PmpR family DNA-binding transcriptional regulator [Planctomycetales bacterium]